MNSFTKVSEDEFSMDVADMELDSGVVPDGSFDLELNEDLDNDTALKSIGEGQITPIEFHEDDDPQESIQPEDIECLILNLIEAGKEDDVLALISVQDGKGSALPADLCKEFALAFVKASSQNPCLFQYRGLIKAGIPLSVKDGRLVMGFKTCGDILDFTSKCGKHLKAELRDSSPIVDALMSYREYAEEKSLQASKQKVVSEQMISDNEMDTDEEYFDDFEVGDDTLMGDLSEDPKTQTADFTMEDTGLGIDLPVDTELPTLEDVPVEAPQLEISLAAFSTKHIAEYLMESNPDITADEVRAILKEEGFPSARASEVIAVLNYLKTNKSLEARLEAMKPKRSGSPSPSEFKWQ